MPAPIDDLNLLRLHDLRLDDFHIRFPLYATVRVLVVADTSVSTHPDGEFGVGRFIELLRATKLGCTGFDVDVARRDAGAFSDAGDGVAGDRYQGFRFDAEVGGQKVIDRYHEIFMFGFAPDNNGQTDANIDGHPLAMQDDEKDAIDGWMDAGGGVFATGDHDYLGATMCHRITRVGSMRQWTNADGVPPISGPDRIDAHRPSTPAEASGAVVISGAEGDATPQPIEWVAVTDHLHGLFRYRRPHEVLCHPTHGPIDVMPDHNHEGRCFTPAEIEASTERRADFPGSELPQIIAWGNTLADPPLQHFKGDTPAKHFPMISVYDGWQEDVGRVVVDSTWHHWFNLNIHALEAEGGEEWDKVSRYFVNVAKWIAPKGVYRSVCWWDVVIAHLDTITIEELHPNAHVLDLGSALYDHLAHIHGPCTVREFIFGSLCDRVPVLCEGLRERYLQPKLPDPCWSCPSIDVIERIVLGGMARGTMELAQRIRDAGLKGGTLEMSVEEVQSAALEGMDRALASFSKDVVASAHDVAEMFGAAIDPRSSTGKAKAT